MLSKCKMWFLKMFNESTTNAIRSFFKWPWTMHHTGDLNEVLLSSVSPEIELSDYRRLPCDDIESPLDILKGEKQKLGPIPDLDRFFGRLYSYYCAHGLRCIVIRWIGNNASLGFTIVFSGICLLCVDWHRLINLKCGANAAQCDLGEVFFRNHPLKPFTLYTGVVVGYLGLFSLYWIFCFLIFFAQLKDTLDSRDFYWKSLNITDQELQRMSWSTVLEKTILFQSIERLCVVKDLSAHDVVMRIMRKDNYLIGMLNKGVLAIPIPQWVPGAGPVVHRDANGTEYRLMLTRTLEWILNWCILQNMFDRNFLIRKDFINNPGLLRRRLRLVGLLMIVLLPFLAIFMLVYHFLMHAEQFYNHPSTAFSRRWSNLAKWLFRDFNELDHLFKSRLIGGIKHANDYVKQFPSPAVSLIAKHVSFMTGGLAAILIVIALLEESLLEGQLFGRNLLWYTAVFGAIIAISRELIADDLPEFDPEGIMALVAQHTHYMPKSWRGAEKSEYVRREFESLFQYTLMLLFQDMASLFVTPCVLIWLLPKRVDAILQFIKDFTVNVEGVGEVCSLSVFDFELHGNSKYGSPCNTSKDCRSGQGKMEKSFLSFKSSYPSWEPNAQGKQFLYTLSDFRKQEQDRQATQMYSPDRVSQRLPTGRGLGSGYSSVLREGLPHRWPFSRPYPDFQIGQLDQPWTAEIEQKDHLYWLDRYYTFQSLYGSDAKDNQAGIAGLEQNLLDTVGREESLDKTRTHGFYMDERLRSHMEASTSSAIYQDDITPQGTAIPVGQTDDSRWWARNANLSFHGYESFREPPQFTGCHLVDAIEESSYGSDKEQGTTSELKQSTPAYSSTFIDNKLNALHLPYENEGRDTIWAMRQSSATYASTFQNENNAEFGLLFCDMSGQATSNIEERMPHEVIEDREE